MDTASSGRSNGNIDRGIELVEGLHHAPAPYISKEH
jgi:hypothetical protein